MWTATDCLLLGALCGGTKNIVKIISCFTRVHVQVKDLELIDGKKRARLEKLPLVKMVLFRGDEVQLVVGTDSETVAKLCRRHLGLSS